MKFRSASKDDKNQIIEILPKDSIIRNEELLNTILADKKSPHQVIEIDNNIVAVALGIQKTILEKNTSLKKDLLIKEIISKIKYEFIYFNIFTIKKEYQNKGYERMLMYSFLDECKGKTTIAAIVENATNDNQDILLFNQIQAMKFEQIDTIQINDKSKQATYLLFEKDN